MTGWLATGLRMPPYENFAAITTYDPIRDAAVQYRFDSPEHRLAWDFTAEAQRRVLSQGANPVACWLETYVVAPSTADSNGRFDALFADPTNEKDYRLLFHRAASIPVGSPLLDVWNAMTHEYRQTRGGGITKQGQPIVSQFLDDVMMSTKGDDAAIKQVFEQTGHPYAHSLGFLER